MTLWRAGIGLAGFLVLLASCFRVVMVPARRAPPPSQASRGSVQGEGMVSTPTQPPAVHEPPATSPPPAPPPPAPTIRPQPPARFKPKRVAVGEAHVCALMGGDVHCWGNNYKGTLGLGTQAEPASGVVRGIGDDSEDVVQIAAGDYHTCVLTASGQMWCWGSNHVAQLGQGKTTELPINTPQRIHETGIRSIHAGPKSTCVIKHDGRVYCWGQNTVSAIAAGKEPVTSPVAVAALEGAEELAIGDYAICALRASRVSCTGWLADQNAALAALPPVTSIAAGWGQGCAVAGGDVYCWGRNYQGSVGIGDPCAGEPTREAKSRCRLKQADLSQPPTRVAQGLEVSCGTAQSCARDASKRVACWGSNHGNAYAPDLPTDQYQTARTLPGIEAVDELYVGDTHICFVRAGKLSCRGKPWADAVTGDIAVSR